MIALYHSYSNDMYVKLTSVIDFDSNGGLEGIRDYSFFDSNNGVVSALDYNMAGTVMSITNDGGKNWQLIYCDTSYWQGDSIYVPKHSVQFIKYFSDGTIIAITNFGKVIKSTDFGKTFIEYEIPNVSTEAFIMIDKDFAILTSTAWEYYPDAKWQQLISTDGCNTWKTLELPDYIPINRMLHINPLRENMFDLWYSTKDKEGIINHVITDKNLKDFLYIETSDRNRDLCFIDNNTIIGGGKLTAPGGGSAMTDTAFLAKTTDGGETWNYKYRSTFPYINILSINYINDSLLVATGESNLLLLSTDEGETWFRPDIEYYDKAFFGSRFYSKIREIDKGLYLLMANWPRQLLKIEFVNGISSVVDNISIRQIKVFPNPIVSGNTFNFEFNISQSGNLKTYITDVSGKEISVLYDDFIEIGDYTKQFQLPASLASGPYLLINDINGFQHSKLLNIVK